MNNDNTNDQNANKENSGHDPSSTTNRGGWGYPFGYHLPCFKEVNTKSAHACDKEEQYGPFIVNEAASHFEN